MSFQLDGYIDVAERIREFRRQYPNGSLRPHNPDKPFEVVTLQTDDGRTKTYIVYVAAAFRSPDDPCAGIGVAWEPFEGKTPYTRDSELMNAETSAWGRAIVAALAADTQKIASLQEVRNRQGSSEPQQRSREQMIADANDKSDTIKRANQAPSNVTPINATGAGITEPQKKLLSKLARERGSDPAEFAGSVIDRQVASIDELSKREAMSVITELTNGRSK